METASLAAVEPPDIAYRLRAHKELVQKKALSALQLEAVVYACQRHQQVGEGGRKGGRGLYKVGWLRSLQQLSALGLVYGCQVHQQVGKGRRKEGRRGSGGARSS